MRPSRSVYVCYACLGLPCAFSSVLKAMARHADTSDGHVTTPDSKRGGRERRHRGQAARADSVASGGSIPDAEPLKSTAPAKQASFMIPVHAPCRTMCEGPRLHDIRCLLGQQLTRLP